MSKGISAISNFHNNPPEPVSHHRLHPFIWEKLKSTFCEINNLLMIFLYLYGILIVNLFLVCVYFQNYMNKTKG